MTRDASAHVAELVGDGFGGDICTVEVAADAVKFLGDKVEGNVVGGVVGEGKVVASLVVQAENLEGSAGESGMTGWVAWKWRLEIDVVAIRVRRTFGKPERVLSESRIETDAGQGTPEFEAVFLLPGEDSRVGQCGVEESKHTHKICVGRFVCWARWLFAPGDGTQDLVEDSRRRAEQIRAIVRPSETSHCLYRRTLRGVQHVSSTFAINIIEGGVVLIGVFDAEAYGWVRDEMLIRIIVDFPLNSHALSGHAVKGGLVETNRSRRSVGIIWVHGDDSHWIRRVVVESVQARSGTVRILVEAYLSWFDVEEVDHCLSNCNAELIA